MLVKPAFWACLNFSSIDHFLPLAGCPIRDQKLANCLRTGGVLEEEDFMGNRMIKDESEGSIYLHAELGRDRFRPIVGSALSAC